MNVPGELLEDLRGLARKYGSVALVEGCAEFVKRFAMRGMQAEIAEKQGDPSEDCPRCRERAALLEDTKRALRQGGGVAQGGRATASDPDDPED